MLDASFPSTGPRRDGPTGNGPADFDLDGTVVVQLGERAGTRAADHRRLAALVARLTGANPTSVTLAQDCPTCGESGHGPLTVAVGGATGSSAAVHVSLARAAGRIAFAVTGAGPVGIDLESTAALALAPVRRVLLSRPEAEVVASLDQPEAAAALAALWTTKEAVLKAAGVGLRVDPRDLTVTLESQAESVTGEPRGDTGHRMLAGWPGAPFPLDRVHLLPVDSPAGTVTTVAVVHAVRPRLRLLPAGY